MDLNPWERRQKILEALCLRRHDTYGNLAHEFNVSTGTIRRDIVVLTCSYPIETVQGGWSRRCQSCGVVPPGPPFAELYRDHFPPQAGGAS
jgi:predicted DNA-binding transcriptional regulator YafY